MAERANQDFLNRDYTPPRLSDDHPLRVAYDEAWSLAGMIERAW